MGIGELLLLAVGLSMDAFAVSICKGLAVKSVRWTDNCKCGLWFGGFQALMPLIGFFLGSLFADAIASFDHWVAFGLLALIGINMLREAFSKDGEGDGSGADMSFKTMLVLAVATSIDALAVGISLAMAGNVDIFLAVALIGIVTFVLSALGVQIGSIFGCRFEKTAEAVGGILLIVLGLKILAEHLLEHMGGLI